ncbi:hypothetical protein [Planotetraspora silvatica]|nr:hypothetical protein [Planotetraspora silvatica]
MNDATTAERTRQQLPLGLGDNGQIAANLVSLQFKGHFPCSGSGL